MLSDRDWVRGCPGTPDLVDAPALVDVVRRRSRAVVRHGQLILIGLAALTCNWRIHAQPGSLDITFSAPTFTGQYSSVRAVAVQKDGRIVVGGGFSNVGGVARSGIVRLNGDGSLDLSFADPGLLIGEDILEVFQVAVQGDGKIIVGGELSAFYGNVRRYGIARLNSDGAIDSAFNCVLSSNAPIFSVRLQPDNRILIGGTFYQVNGFTQYCVARLNPDGTRDGSFGLNVVPTRGARVSALGLQADGKIIVGGNYSAVIEGVTKTALSRLNADGTLDRSFGTVLGLGAFGTGYPTVDTVAVQPDGRILIEGFFGSVNGSDRAGAARLNADGTLDSSFEGSFVSGTRGEIILFQGVNRIHFGDPFNTDGNVDLSSWPPGVVECVAFQGDGKALFGGAGTLLRVFAGGGSVPAITLQPQDAATWAGYSDNIGFLVTATGTGPLSYQWRKNGTTIPAANGASWSIFGAQIADSGRYDVVIGNAYGAVTSRVATLVVTNMPPRYTFPPQSQNVASGGRVEFSVSGVDGTPPLT